MTSNNTTIASFWLLLSWILIVDICHHQGYHAFAWTTTRPLSRKAFKKSVVEIRRASPLCAVADPDEDSATTKNASTHNLSRRSLLQQQATTAMLMTSSALLGVGGTPTPVFAKDDEIVEYDPQEVKAAFDAIRYELENPKGGVQYMQQCIDKGDYAALLEFTKTYDLELRKAKMSQAKKKFKMAGDLPTRLCNNATFDLIGINKSCRKGQEDLKQAQKYLDELKQDVSQFLELQSDIPLAKA